MRSLARAAAAFVAAVVIVAAAGTAEAKKAAEGMPPFKPTNAEALGIWIWHDAQGWHLRGSTGGKQHSFRGVVRPITGDLVKVKATRPSIASKVDAAGGKAIHFDFDLLDGVDGFDWDGADPCMTFELKIDKKTQEEKVHVGAKSESPSAIPFDACK